MDKVGDLLIRIKNGYLASKKEVIIPYSKLNLAICQLLTKEGYLGKCEASGREVMASLKYEGRKAALTDVKRISKPGRRVYSSRRALPRVYNGLGLAIVSTPKGIMSEKQAKKEGLGGEVMAYIW